MTLTPAQKKLVAEANLTRQLYGLQMAQGKFGGPTGIWIECRACPESQRIVGSTEPEWIDQMPNAGVVTVYRRHGWTMDANGKNARCPSCAIKAAKMAEAQRAAEIATS